MTKIKSVGVASEQAFKELNKIQKGEKLLLKTGMPFFDEHIGGLLYGDVCLISASPGAGKTYTLRSILDNIFNEEINPQAKNFVGLEFNLELRALNVILRGVKKKLGKSNKEVLFNEFTQEEREKVLEYYKELKDGRRFLVDEPVTPEEFYSECRHFCTQHKDKDAIIISYDHLLLTIGTDKQKVLERITEYVNLLKLEFDNVYFILLSQNNRSSHANVKEKSNEMRPDNSWIFGSSFMEQLASYIVIQTDPFRQSVVEYLSVYPERYDYLKDYMTDVNSKGKCHFHTAGYIFAFVTKMRESDNFSKDLFILEKDLDEKQRAHLDKQLEGLKKETESLPTEPMFPEDPFKGIKPIDTTEAFGDDDKPF